MKNESLGDEVLAEVSEKAYPPYPRTKKAYIEILQRAMNKAENEGYERGYRNGKEYFLNFKADKYGIALCKLIDKFMEKS